MFKALLLCSLVAVICAENWLGKWFVVKSGTNSQFECVAPQARTYTTIVASKKGLRMDGTDSDGRDATWDLVWNATDTVVTDACTGVLCASANLSSISGVTYAKINWQISEKYFCEATLIQRNPHLTEEVEVAEPAQTVEVPEVEEVAELYNSDDIEEFEDIMSVVEPFRAAEPWLHV